MLILTEWKGIRYAEKKKEQEMMKFNINIFDTRK